MTSRLQGVIYTCKLLAIIILGKKGINLNHTEHQQTVLRKQIE